MARRTRVENSKQLKRQPKLQKAKRAPVFGGVVTPSKSVSQRKRYKSWRKVEGPLKTVQNFVFSSRWISLALLSASVYFLYGFVNSPDYFITQIPIVGADSVPMDEIALTSGLAGKHIFTADPEAAAEAILELPGITAVDVRLDWPNQVDIVVVEEQPVAIWMSNGTAWWVNKQGGLFPAREDRPDLMVIEGFGQDGIVGRDMPEVIIDDITGEALEPGMIDPESGDEVAEINYGAIPDEILHGAVQLSRLQPYGEPINAFKYNVSSGLHFTDPRGWDAHFGIGINMDQKLAVYNALVNELALQGIVPIFISVENPNRPIYRNY